MNAIVRVLAPLGLEEVAEAAPLLAVAAQTGASEIEAYAHGPHDDADAHVEAFAQALGAAPAAALTLLPAGAEDIAARLATRLGAAALGRCARVELTDAGVRVERDAFGGRARATLRVAGNAFATMRANVIVAPAEAGAQFRLVPPAPGFVPAKIDRREIPAGRKRLEGARVVVSGGRGIAAPEGFTQLDSLAAALDAAVGGSLPTIDAGWVPVSCQVGQSGKFVTPEVYVAVAISGTPQHLAGIGPDTRIVAINKDPDADIFRVAEIGAVGDWREIVPALAKALQ